MLAPTVVYVSRCPFSETWRVDNTLSTVPFYGEYHTLAKAMTHIESGLILLNITNYTITINRES